MFLYNQCDHLTTIVNVGTMSVCENVAPAAEQNLSSVLLLFLSGHFINETAFQENLFMI